MDLQSWTNALRKFWWLVLTTTLLAAGVGVLITVHSPSLYASTVTFFVKTPAEQIGGAEQGDQFGQKRVNSYVQLVDSRSLAQLVIRDTQVDLTPEQVTSELTAKGDLNTVLLTVTVVDKIPSRSLAIANSVSTEFVKLVAGLETPPGSTTPTVTLDVTSAATLNPQPVEPRPLLTLSISVLLGLALGVIAAIVIESMDNTIRAVAMARQVTKAPNLGVIPFDLTAKRSPLIVDDDARSVRAEALRQLRTNLQFIDLGSPLKLIVVSSSVAAEGKSSTATNLAVIFAEAGQRVLLIEADLRRPRVADYLGLEGSIGLTNVLAGQVDIAEVLQPWGKGGLTVLPSGSIPPNPSELLGSQDMADLLQSFKEKFDRIVIDTPPLLPVTDGAIVAAHSDGAILVVRHGKTNRSQVANAVMALGAVEARLLGTVLNMVPVKGIDAYSYGYGYYASDAREGKSQPTQSQRYRRGRRAPVHQST